ncbi:iron chelate uptake ABC transporter family permease subunit [Microbacterium gorillae]|uniref:iron chelate uptake ABC transporter family permease subunit n=1 Tax=Microbacterium gorillae TaxID=1231063 RepID=UPI000B28B6A5|nr:iron chelate uptake ABC transporter family permease subunit [Microbacterium gorillae]
MVDTLTAAPVATPTRRGLPYAARLGIVAAIAVVAAVLVLTWGIASEPGSNAFWLLVNRRAITVVTITLVATAQAIAVVLFHTATGNRILTPSIMGFDALYVVIQTSMVFFFGAQSLTATDGVPKVLAQSALMVVFATGLYGWLFGGKRGNLHITLLIGLVLGVGFGTLSTFMQRMLDPGEFDILSARLFGSIANSNAEYLPWAGAIIVIVAVVVFFRRHRLDVLALGRDTATNLGLSYKREVMALFVLVAMLISISTTLVGPMTFFGFIVATLSYQLCGSAEHRRVLPFAVLLGIATLLSAYFVLRNVFSAAGLVTVIIEFVGGLAFVIILLRKGTL